MTDPTTDDLVPVDDLHPMLRLYVKAAELEEGKVHRRRVEARFYAMQGRSKKDLAAEGEQRLGIRQHVDGNDDLATTAVSSAFVSPAGSEGWVVVELDK